MKFKKINESYTARIVTNGTALATNIPQYIVKKYNLHKGGEVEINLEANMCVIGENEKTSKLLESFIEKYPQLKKFESSDVFTYMLVRGFCEKKIIRKFTDSDIFKRLTKEEAKILTDIDKEVNTK